MLQYYRRIILNNKQWFIFFVQSNFLVFTLGVNLLKIANNFTHAV